MKFLTSTKTNPVLVNVVLLVVRIFVGFGMLTHGYPKLQKLTDSQEIEFMDFLGLGPQITLGLVVLAEFVGSIFLILGLFSRISVFFLAFTMAIAAFVVHGLNPFNESELSLLYLCVYLLLLAFGPGKYSIDAMINKKRESRW